VLELKIISRSVLFPLIAILVAALFLAGCGGKARDPLEAFTMAAQAAREAGSMHARLNVALSPLEGEQGMGLNVQGDAWMDMDMDRLEARFTVMGMEVSMRYVDGTAYVQFGGTWYVLEGVVVEGIGEGTIDALVGMLSDIPEIISSTREVNELGEKTVGDCECRLFEVVPDLQAISAMDSVVELAGELEMSSGEVLEYLEEADTVIEVCVQKDEPIIRQVFLAASLELPSVSELLGIPLLPENARVEITMDFPEYGVDVNIKAPEGAVPFEGL
jgi:hypothetical protein